MLFDDELKCSNCKKKIKKNENIIIQANSNELKGHTFLKNWIANHKVLCEQCAKNNLLF